ncbi:LppA family lipoprotein [Sanguibacter sp. 25GB23B1]|uniref:LppA family lipoprotein n=1 Tax=unclassified Sanguibacter TaxID=2645534 RepID=UPI0032AFFF0F
MTRCGVRRPRSWFLLWALPALGVAVLVGAFLVQLVPPTSTETMAMLAERPSKEAAVARYEQMRQEITDRLDTELGAREWEPSASYPEGSLASACSDADGGAQIVSLVLYGFAGTYDRADWRRSQEIVSEVATEYGFTVGEVPDRPRDGAEITGADPYGARFTYGTGTNTGLTIRTGCHLPEDLLPAG